MRNPKYQDLNVRAVYNRYWDANTDKNEMDLCRQELEVRAEEGDNDALRCYVATYIDSYLEYLPITKIKPREDYFREGNYKAYWNWTDLYEAPFKQVVYFYCRYTYVLMRLLQEPNVMPNVKNLITKQIRMDMEDKNFAAVYKKERGEFPVELLRLQEEWRNKEKQEEFAKEWKEQELGLERVKQYNTPTTQDFSVILENLHEMDYSVTVRDFLHGDCYKMENIELLYQINLKELYSEVAKGKNQSTLEQIQQRYLNDLRMFICNNKLSPEQFKSLIELMMKNPSRWLNLILKQLRLYESKSDKNELENIRDFIGEISKCCTKVKNDQFYKEIFTIWFKYGMFEVIDQSFLHVVVINVVLCTMNSARILEYPCLGNPRAGYLFSENMDLERFMRILDIGYYTPERFCEFAEDIKGPDNLRALAFFCAWLLANKTPNPKDDYLCQAFHLGEVNAIPNFMAYCDKENAGIGNRVVWFWNAAKKYQKPEYLEALWEQVKPYLNQSRKFTGITLDFEKEFLVAFFTQNFSNLSILYYKDRNKFEEQKKNILNTPEILKNKIQSSCNFLLKWFPNPKSEEAFSNDFVEEAKLLSVKILNTSTHLNKEYFIKNINVSQDLKALKDILAEVVRAHPDSFVAYNPVGTPLRYLLDFCFPKVNPSLRASTRLPVQNIQIMTEQVTNLKAMILELFENNKETATLSRELDKQFQNAQDISAVLNVVNTFTQKQEVVNNKKLVDDIAKEIAKVIAQPSAPPESLKIPFQNQSLRQSVWNQLSASRLPSAPPMQSTQSTFNQSVSIPVPQNAYSKTQNQIKWDGWISALTQAGMDEEAAKEILEIDDVYIDEISFQIMDKPVVANTTSGVVRTYDQTTYDKLPITAEGKKQEPNSRLIILDYKGNQKVSDGLSKQMNKLENIYLRELSKLKEKNAASINVTTTTTTTTSAAVVLEKLNAELPKVEEALEQKSEEVAHHPSPISQPALTDAQKTEVLLKTLPEVPSALPESDATENKITEKKLTYA